MAHKETNEEIMGAAVAAMKANDWKAAATLFKVLANERDVIDAHYLVGSMHKHGKGLPVDLDLARHHLNRAAEQGDVGAKFELADILSSNPENKEDSTRAIDLLLSAAMAGHDKALILVHQLADAGQTIAQSQLAVQYLEGAGVPEDARLALKYARSAATKGNPAGQWVMGSLTEKGLFVRQDYIEAHMWYNLASASNNAQVAIAAGISRDGLAAKMTVDQLNEALTAARSWSAVAER